MPNNKSNGKTAINGLAGPLPLPIFTTRGGVEGHPQALMRPLVNANDGASRYSSPARESLLKKEN
jgi:hypothetical protein